MNSALAAHYNTARVLRLVWRNPGISRIETAERLGLNPSTVTNIVAELLSRGLVRTLAPGDAPSAGGRKKVPLAVDPSFGCVGGVQVHSDLLRLVLVDVAGTELHREMIQGPVNDSTLYGRLRQASDRLQERAAVLGTRMLGVGCGLPGIVDPVKGTLKQSIPLGIMHEEPVAERMRTFVSLPLFLDNDAKTCCWGELVANRDPPPNFMFILGEWRRSPARTGSVTAVGVGIVLNGVVHHGRTFSAGEFRSVDWRPGNVSQFSLPDDVVDAARNDRRLFLEVVRELARNTALTVHMLNLDRVYLGGFFDADDAEVRDVFDEEIRRNWAYDTPASCEVAFSSYGGWAVALGAAGLFLERAFGDPGALAYLGHEAGVPLLMQA